MKKTTKEIKITATIETTTMMIVLEFDYKS
jgi:hypothetical protein